MKDSSLTQTLRETFHYSIVSGKLYWREDRPREHFANQKAHTRYLNVQAGKQVKASTSAYGYWVVGLKNCGVLLVHRIAYVLVWGHFPEAGIDHFDGDKKNNCWLNLREASQEINTRNQKKNVRNTSGFAGVSRGKKDGTWRSHVYVNDIHIHLGTFDTPDQAYEARMAYLNAHPELGYTAEHGHRV